jgi:hypothetical protein
LAPILPKCGNVYPLHLQTGSISDAFPLAPFASPLRSLWLKKIILIRFGEPSFSRLAPILPKCGNVYPLHLQTGSISDAFPLAPFASPLRTLWLKKIILTCIGEPFFFQLAPILPKCGNVFPLHLQTGSISDAFPLAPFASPLRTLWLKK